jgi:(2Fe-2S) ferredoxin
MRLNDGSASVKKPTYHIFVCNSFRVGGDPQGVCNRKDAVNLLQILEEEVSDRGLDAMVSSTGCLKMCEKGPVIVVYPQGWWYTEVDPEKLDQILDAMEEDEPAEELLVA